MFNSALKQVTRHVCRKHAFLKPGLMPGAASRLFCKEHQDGESRNVPNPRLTGLGKEGVNFWWLWEERAASRKEKGADDPRLFAEISD